MDKKKKATTRPDIKKLLKDPDLLAGILITLCLSFMLCIYAPYEMYMTNQYDFWFDSKAMIWPTLSLFLLSTFLGITAFVVSRLLNRKLFYALLAGTLAATIATYIQGTFLVSGLPPLDGTTYNWRAASPERTKTIVVWAVTIAVTVFICLKFRSKVLKIITKFVSIALIFMLATSLFSIYIGPFDKEHQGSDKLLCTNKNVYNMSSDTNMVIFVLDSVDNGMFRKALDSNPEFQNLFDDFTYYNNTLSGYLFTTETFPFIFSSDWYENDETFTEYQNNAFANSSLLKALDERGYTTGLYGTFHDRFKAEYLEGRFENFIEGRNSFTDWLSAVKVVGRMAGIRYAPWDLKGFMYKINFSLESSHQVDSEYPIYTWSNVDFYQNMTGAEPFDIVDEKVCRVIHLEGAHAPFQYDKDMNPVAAEDAVYYNCVEACLTLCNSYISALKENGLYDNTAIVIMSDHGYTDDTETYLLGRANPILLVKGVNEHHDTIISEAPISHEDFSESLIGLLDGKGGNEIFDYKEGDVRERRVMVYEVTKESLMKEYVTTGHASDTSAMQPTGKEYIWSD